MGGLGRKRQLSAPADGEAPIPCTILPLPDGYKPERVAQALARKIQIPPDALRRSLTWDQGPGLRDWQQVHAGAGIEVFFCDLHSPRQRGTNEIADWLLRQYFPKGR
jgi:IS30 family transposase